MMAFEAISLRDSILPMDSSSPSAKTEGEKKQTKNNDEAAAEDLKRRLEDLLKPHEELQEYARNLIDNKLSIEVCCPTALTEKSFLSSSWDLIITHPAGLAIIISSQSTRQSQQPRSREGKDG